MHAPTKPPANPATIAFRVALSARCLPFQACVPSSAPVRPGSTPSPILANQAVVGGDAVRAVHVNAHFAHLESEREQTEQFTHDACCFEWRMRHCDANTLCYAPTMRPRRPSVCLTHRNSVSTVPIASPVPAGRFALHDAAEFRQHHQRCRRVQP
jgi:hypothetical protein